MEKSSAEKHLHSLKAYDEIENNTDVSFPDQLYFHTFSINQLMKDDTQAFLVHETALVQS